jgi:hypothetical protein
MNNNETFTSHEDLLTENIKLKQQLEELKAEHHTIVVTIVKVLRSVGLWPLSEGDNLAKKAIKGVQGVIAESIYNAKGLEKRFDFLKEIYPLCEKYKDIQID